MSEDESKHDSQLFLIFSPINTTTIEFSRLSGKKIPGKRILDKNSSSRCKKYFTFDRGRLLLGEKITKSIRSSILKKKIYPKKLDRNSFPCRNAHSIDTYLEPLVEFI